METTDTTFGKVERSETNTRVSASGETLSSWSLRGDSSWPCSRLAGLLWIKVDFDSHGDLVDIESNLPYEEWEIDGPTADEVNAWTSETLVRAGYPNHPAIR